MRVYPMSRLRSTRRPTTTGPMRARSAGPAHPLRRSDMAGDVRIETATVHDVPLLLSLIRALAEYERMSNAVVATEASLRDSLFGATPCAEAAIAHVDREAVGFALW